MVTIFGIISILGLDYSDQEIAASMVDTWEVAALGSYPILGLTAVIAAVSFILSREHTGISRQKLLVTAWLAVFAFAVCFAGMLVLTRRAETLSGSDLSGLFYFF